MPPHPVHVSDLVRQRARRAGRPGQEWLDHLPALVADLERRWSITMTGALAGGSASYVTRARTTDHRDVIVKLMVPGEDFASQVTTIRRAGGRGYVRLLAHDDVGRAMMLESLGPSLDQLAAAPEHAIEILCATLRLAWEVPAPPAAPAQEKAAQLGRIVVDLWTALDRPCSPRVVGEALRFAERRAAAFDLTRCVVVHGDPHPGNAPRVPAPRTGAESGFVLVDPDGFLADPAYDLGVVLRGWCAELLAAADPRALALDHCRLLADRTGVDGTSIWEWGFLERVSTGLYLLSLGADEEGWSYLRTATRLVDA